MAQSNVSYVEFGDKSVVLGSFKCYRIITNELFESGADAINISGLLV